MRAMSKVIENQTGGHNRAGNHKVEARTDYEMLSSL